MEVEQRSVIFYMKRKGYKLAQIHQKLHDVYQQESFDIPRIKYWIHQFKLKRNEVLNETKGGRPVIDYIDTKIITALHDHPFHSTRSLSETLSIPRTTIIHHLERMGFKNYNLRVVPHDLSDEMKAKRVSESMQLLDVLRVQKRKGFHRILTGDESWFYLQYDHKHVWSISKEEVPERVSQKIQTKKIMLTVIWNIDQFYIINLMKNNENFNSEYFIHNVIKPLENKLYPQGKKPQETSYIIHIDNARPHNSHKATESIVKCGFKRAPHPPYSPDLSPSDFYLFGYIKNQLEGEAFDEPDHLYLKIQEILCSIPKETLIAVFDEWIRRCEWVIKHKGDYYHK